jgi:type IV pilus assembly protein PilB
VARLVDLIIAEALNLNATAIRIDLEPDGLPVRYRLEGQWVDRDRVPRRLLNPIVARIGFLAGINISGEEPEQTGRMRGTSLGRSFDLAVLVRRTKEGPGLLLTFVQPDT